MNDLIDVLVALLLIVWFAASLFSVWSLGQLNATRDSLAAENARLRLDLHAARAEVKESTDRLVAAWREGYTVPVNEELDPPPEPVRFTSEQETWLDQWEDVKVRARWEQFLVSRMREGRTASAALADAELKLVEGQERLLTPQPVSSSTIQFG